MAREKLKRVIHILEDGRRKYSTFHGVIEKYDNNEIEAFRCNMLKCGNSAFLADFSVYSVVYSDLKHRFPAAKVIRVVDIEIEDYNLPIDNNIIF